MDARIIFLLFTFFLILLVERTGVIKMNETKVGKERVSNLSITIVYDNRIIKEGLTSDWGFGCLIEADREAILFDTGTNGKILIDNMQKLGIDLKKIKKVFLSHIHSDHTGGLTEIINLNKNLTIFLPSSFPKSFKDELKGYVKVVEISEVSEIGRGIYSTGELGTWIKEQSLVINTEKGLVIVTGCSHPGILNIIKKAKEIDKKVHLVVGGFHLFAESEERIKEIVKGFRTLNVKEVVPCHCTGDLAISLFEREYKENFVKCGVGRVITI